MQARFVLDYYIRHYRNKMPVIILGDFNCVPPSAARKNGFSDEPDADYRKDKTMSIFYGEPTLTEAFLSVDGRPHTFPSEGPDRRLDYIFYTGDTIRKTGSRVLPLNSSDHLPVVLEFQLKESKK